MMPVRVNAVVLFAIICHSAQSISQNFEYLVTPFCNSSFRLQVRPIQPISPPSNVTLDHPGALILKNNEHCSPQESTLVDPSESITNQNLRLERTSNNVIKFWNVKTDMLLFQIDEIVLTPSIIIPHLLQTSVTTSNDRTAQKIFGLGQGNWSQGNGGAGGGCGEFAPYFFFRSCSYHSFFLPLFSLHPSLSSLTNSCRQQHRTRRPTPSQRADCQSSPTKVSHIHTIHLLLLWLRSPLQSWWVRRSFRRCTRWSKLVTRSSSRC